MNKSPSKFRRVITVALFIFTVLFFIYFVFNSSKIFKLLVHSTMEIIVPFQEATSSTFSGFNSLWDGYIDLVSVRKENMRLQNEINKIRLENSQLKELAIGNERFRKLLGFKKDCPQRLLPASVISADSTGWFMTVIINKGSADGIKKFMPVINEKGLIGRIIEVSFNYSKVLLITDINSSVPVLIQRTRSRGIVRGNGSFVLQLDYVRLNQEIKKGDIIITSGLGGIFTKGIPVGEIIDVTSFDSGLFYEIEINPFVDTGNIEDVLIVLNEHESSLITLE